MNCMEDGSLCIWYGPEVTVGQKDQLLKLKKKKKKKNKQTNMKWRRARTNQNL